MAEQVRVRFAPSPTGYLHVGGARTALFNWLLARRTGGVFVLRIEDTDLARSTEAAVNAIFAGMKWLGLDWDEGPGAKEPHAPYFQTQRLEIYNKYVQQLLDSGRAYKCWMTPEQLEANLKALEIRFSPEDLAEIDRITLVDEDRTVAPVQKLLRKD